jgi:hypothetical protein
MLTIIFQENERNENDYNFLMLSRSWYIFGNIKGLKGSSNKMIQKKNAITQ